MKYKILKSDILLAKAFLAFAYPPFVYELELVMDIDYIAGLCNSFIKKEALLYNLSDISDEQTIKIQEYLNLNGTNIDWIFYYVLLSIQMLLHKYYNADGTFKTIL